MKYLFSIFAFVLLFSCNTQKAQSPYTTIEYETGACRGFCPVYKMTIAEDRSAILEAERFNFTKGEFSNEREGTFKATIKKEDYEKLITLLKDLDIKNLNSKYGNHNITDLPMSYLRIKFPDGTSREVEDYGKRGTKKLSEVHQFFEALKLNQQWTKIK